MSNLAKAILARDTGERKLIKEKTSRLFQNVFNMREDIAPYSGPAPAIAKVYKIGVTLGNDCMVTEIDYMKHEDALDYAIERTKKQVIEAVFGEFRQDIRLIERHLYNYEFEEAATALRRMEDKMFSTED